MGWNGVGQGGAWQNGLGAWYEMKWGKIEQIELDKMGWDKVSCDITRWAGMDRRVGVG